MSKIIIHNKIGDDMLAMELVATAMKQGKISECGKSYCYVSSFTIGAKEAFCTCVWNKKSTFTFEVYYKKENGRNEQI